MGATNGDTNGVTNGDTNGMVDTNGSTISHDKLKLYSAIFY